MTRAPLSLALASLLGLSPLLAGGCQSTRAATPVDPQGAAAVEQPPLAKEWQDMSKDERRELMKTVVVPRMNALFREFDPQRFPQVRCTTCHGESAKNGRFSMPNPDLPRLGLADHLAKERAEKPAIVAFMSRRVVPEMAAALGVKPFDPGTGEGFGCRDCHMAKD
jgi:hypothetical protein